MEGDLRADFALTAGLLTNWVCPYCVCSARGHCA